MDMKKEDQNKPYEPKKSVWVGCISFIFLNQTSIDIIPSQVPCPKTGGYREGFLESGGDIANIGAEGADLTVKLVVVSGSRLLRWS